MNQKTPSKGKAPQYSRQKEHWYLTVIELQYLKTVKVGEEVRNIRSSETFNMIARFPQRNITAEGMTAVNQAAMEYLPGYGITPEQVQGIVVMNMVYMGNMSERDHFKSTLPTTPAVTN